MKKRAPFDYKGAMKRIRPFVNFNVDLRKAISPADKRRIRRNDNIIRPLLKRKNHVYRPRSKKGKSQLRRVQEFGQHAGFSSNITVAFVPSDGEKGVKLDVGNERITVKMRGVTQITVFFDMQALARNTQREVDRVLDLEPDARVFQIHADEFLIKNPIERSLVASEVQILIDQYKPGGALYKRSPGRGAPSWDNDYQQWLFGLTASEFTNQKNFKAFQKRKFPEDKKSKKKKRKTRPTTTGKKRARKKKTTPRNKRR